MGGSASSEPDVYGWEASEPPLISADDLPPLPSRLADLAALTTQRALGADDRFEHPSSAELPEVQALRGEGWFALDDDPLWRWLPLVWPASHRGWVVDRLPRVASASCLDGRRWIEPWGDELTAQMRQEVAEAAAGCGLPAPPDGRRWFLRSPWPSLAVPTILSMICWRADDLGLRVADEGVLAASREVLGWTEDQVWDRWRGPTAEVARAWRNWGRTGDDAAPLIARGLGPAELAELTSATPDGLAGLTEDAACRWIGAVQQCGADGAASVQGWRRLLGPDADPADVPLAFSEVDSATAATWLATGFSLDDIAVLAGLSLPVASRWRNAGFSPQATRELLSADPDLTPAEARAFGEAGISRELWTAWIACGFTAADARGWTDADVFPNEARVWRSTGLGPGDVERTRAADRPHRSGQRPAADSPRGADASGSAENPQRDDSATDRERPVLPPGVDVGWVGYGTGRAQRSYGVTDPPRADRASSDTIPR